MLCINSLTSDLNFEGINKPFLCKFVSILTKGDCEDKDLNDLSSIFRYQLLTKYHLKSNDNVECYIRSAFGVTKAFTIVLNSSSLLSVI